MFMSIHGTNLFKLPTSFAVFQLISSYPWIHNYFDNVLTNFMINNRTNAWKTDVNLVFTITNCQIVRSRSLTHRTNYKFMCLSAYWRWKLANERARSAVIVKKNNKKYLFCGTYWSVETQLSSSLFLYFIGHLRAKFWEGGKNHLVTILLKITTFYGETCWIALF